MNTAILVETRDETEDHLKRGNIWYHMYKSSSLYHLKSLLLLQNKGQREDVIPVFLKSITSWNLELINNKNNNLIFTIIIKKIDLTKLTNETTL